MTGSLQRFLFLALFVAGLWQTQGSVTAQRIVAPAQEEDCALKFKGIDGKTYDTNEMRGNVVLISFGATWCVPCTQELAALEDLKIEFKNKPVKFFWVSIEPEKDISNAKLRDYGKSLKMTIPILRDPLRVGFGKFSTRVRIPMVVFYDLNGQVSAPKTVGMATVDLYKRTIRERLNQLLAAASPSTGQTK
jgi:thiol-disulfide isomerase/thioredoxin